MKPAEPGWWADTVGEHFGDWSAAAAVLTNLGFPEEAKSWPIARLSTGERLRLALVRAPDHRTESVAPRSYHPLFVFNQLGDVERCALRPGNAGAADISATVEIVASSWIDMLAGLSR